MACSMAACAARGSGSGTIKSCSASALARSDPRTLSRHGSLVVFLCPFICTKTPRLYYLIRPFFENHPKKLSTSPYNLSKGARDAFDLR